MGGGEFEDVERLAGQCLRYDMARGSAEDGGRTTDAAPCRYGIMWREDPVGEADIGQIATDRVDSGVERDRPATQREAATRWRVVGSRRRRRRP